MKRREIDSNNCCVHRRNSGLVHALAAMTSLEAEENRLNLRIIIKGIQNPSIEPTRNHRSYALEFVHDKPKGFSTRAGTWPWGGRVGIKGDDTISSKNRGDFARTWRTVKYPPNAIDMRMSNGWMVRRRRMATAAIRIEWITFRRTWYCRFASWLDDRVETEKSLGNWENDVWECHYILAIFRHHDRSLRKMPNQG